MGESSTTLHLIVKTQLNVAVAPDLLVADFGSNAEFTCKAYRKDEEGQGELDWAKFGKNDLIVGIDPMASMCYMFEIFCSKSLKQNLAPTLNSHARLIAMMKKAKVRR